LPQQNLRVRVYALLLVLIVARRGSNARHSSRRC
jgi:hypothetical protein